MYHEFIEHTSLEERNWLIGYLERLKTVLVNSLGEANWRTRLISTLLTGIRHALPDMERFEYATTIEIVRGTVHGFLDPGVSYHAENLWSRMQAIKSRILADAKNEYPILKAIFSGNAALLENAHLLLGSREEKLQVARYIYAVVYGVEPSADDVAWRDFGMHGECLSVRFHDKKQYALRDMLRQFGFCEGNFMPKDGGEYTGRTKEGWVCVH